MSQAIADATIKGLRATANRITMVADTYVEDTSGDLAADAYILNEIASMIEELDWDIMRQHFLKTYLNKE